LYNYCFRGKVGANVVPHIDYNVWIEIPSATAILKNADFCLLLGKGYPQND